MSSLSSRRPRLPRGFTLLETTIALVLVAMAMTTLVMAFGASSRFGVLTRRQANAVSLARTQAAMLSTLPYTDARITVTSGNTLATYADPSGAFAQSAVPTGTNAPDWPAAGVVQTLTLNGETYEWYVNVVADGSSGKDFAVVIRYRVGTTWARAVVLGYRYNPAANNVSWLPI